MYVDHALVARILNIANMSFNAISENKIIPKIRIYSIQGTLATRIYPEIPQNVAFHQDLQFVRIKASGIKVHIFEFVIYVPVNNFSVMLGCFLV